MECIHSRVKEGSMVLSEIIEGLRTCELFDLLTETEMQILTTSIADAWEMKTCKAGDHMFDQGELSSRLYVIVSGQVLLQRSVDMGAKKATWPLGLLGKGRAMGMILTGEIIDAAEAYRIGLVNQIFPLAELMNNVKELASKLAAKSPLALMLAKDAINTGFDLNLADGIRYEQKNFAILCGSDDKKEGVAAFLEKRKPAFKGQ